MPSDPTKNAFPSLRSRAKEGEGKGLFQPRDRAELDGERSSELDVAPFGGDELRAVDRRAVVDGVEEIESLSM